MSFNQLHNQKKHPTDQVGFNFFKQFFLILLFSGLISIAFLDPDYYYFAWFAFIPLLFAVDKLNLKQTYFIVLIAGLLAFISGSYWILDFITIAKQNRQSSNIGLAFIYWFYCAHQFVLMLLLLNWLRNKTKIHDFILFPIIVASLTFAYPMLFSMRLGESQVGFHIALQGIEFLGVHSLDMIIALTNIMAFHLLRYCLSTQFFKRIKERSIANIKLKMFCNWPWIIGLTLISIWFIYGHYAYNHWQQQIKQWDTLKVGLVQPNEVPKLGDKTIYPGYSHAYPPELEMTKRLASLGAEITIWPEAQTKGYLNNPSIRQAFKNNIKQLNSSLLFQDLRHIKNQYNGKISNRYNSAIMINPLGQQTGIYNKIKRIPFGEYIPLFEPTSWAYQALQKFLGDFLTPYSKGLQQQIFSHKNINLIPLICYETTFPEFVAQAVNTATNIDNPAMQKSVSANILVGLSNDGWFGSTHQPYQHIMASALRAIENRLPLIHAANNGPSIVVTPDGQVILTSDFQKAGGYLVEVPYSNTLQGSFYSRNPNLLTGVLSILMSLLIITALLRSILSGYINRNNSI